VGLRRGLLWWMQLPLCLLLLLLLLALLCALLAG
jgi:hypothetical protein